MMHFEPYSNGTRVILKHSYERDSLSNTYANDGSASICKFCMYCMHIALIPNEVNCDSDVYFLLICSYDVT